MCVFEESIPFRMPLTTLQIYFLLSPLPLFRTRTLIASFLDLFYILMNFLSFNCWLKVWRWYVLICLYMDATRFFPFSGFLSFSLSISWPEMCIYDICWWWCGICKMRTLKLRFLTGANFRYKFHKGISLQTTHICILRGFSWICTSFHQLSESVLQRDVCETFYDVFFSLLDFDDVFFWLLLTHPWNFL